LTWLTTAFLAALILHLAVESWLAIRQMAYVSKHRDHVPPSFSGAVSPADHAKAADYTVARQRLGMLEAVFDSAILLLLTLGGGIARLGEFTYRWFDDPLLRGTAHVLAVLAVLAVLSIPFSAYRTFVLEERFGFNRTTVRMFLSDLLKGGILGLLLGGAVIAAVLAIMGSADRAWWLIAWLAWLGFSLLVTWAWPRFIAPLFNKFTPLASGELRSRIDALLSRCGFEADSIYVMDGSRRSAHGNAYFTGLGRHKRIVLFDTLLSSLTPVQAEAVLAHELAHFRLRHVPQRLLAAAAMTFAGFALLGWLAGKPWFYTSFGVPQPSDAAALLLFVLVSPVFTWIVSPALAAWSRRHEFEADGFAVEHSDGSSLAEALVALYRDNASTLTPDPVYSAFYDSHPPPVRRVARIESARATPSGRHAEA
jgi:STE24 endopeptidase